jgi:hypothetical protein
MEPFEKDELSDRELDDLLRKWEAPVAPARLRAAIFPAESVPMWRRLWSFSVRIPLPAACALGVALTLAGWQVSRPAAPRVEVRTEQVEVPVVQERVVTRTVYRAAAQCNPAAGGLQPVAALQPRIIRTLPDEE